MAFEQKDGSGALFRNDKKESQQHPDYRGSIKVGGIEYWLSAWVKESSKGTKYMSLSAQPKERRQARGYNQTPEEAALPREEFDDDIPF